MSPSAPVVIAISLSTTANAQKRDRSGSQPFTGIVAFGDSLTDTGNLFEISGGVFPPFPYYLGRVSDGPVWIEYLAGEMNLDPESIENYAVAGATSGRENVNDGMPYSSTEVFEDLPGLQDQIDMFEADLNGKRADKHALYVVWAGSNDFFLPSDNPFSTIVTGVHNTNIAVKRLRRLGARRIMVVNLPDLGLIPYFRDPTTPNDLSFLTEVYNSFLEFTLRRQAWRGIKTVRVDAAKVIQSVSSEPEKFGFSNVTDAFLYSGRPFNELSEFLFWDAVHPTSKGHQVLANEAMRVLSRNCRRALGN